MGLLDDAIREHLDLKRKHGVSEDELQRQEEEALGPARRDVAAVQEQDSNGEPVGAEAQAVSPSDGAETESPEEPPASPASERSPPPEATSPATDAPTPAPEAPAPEKTVLDVDEAEPPPAGEEHEVAPAGETPSEGFDAVEEDLESAGEDADVLEDTPDFLQETPDHDRLWFEQKPPRDFDFD
jgi:hypothetical protein